MKKRIPDQNSFPTLFNLGLHKQQTAFFLPGENLSYLRKTETLVNPIRQSSSLTEFVTFF
jgi:hypothetical protein